MIVLLMVVCLCVCANAWHHTVCRSEALHSHLLVGVRLFFFSHSGLLPCIMNPSPASKQWLLSVYIHSQKLSAAQPAHCCFCFFCVCCSYSGRSCRRNDGFKHKVAVSGSGQKGLNEKKKEIKSTLCSLVQGKIKWEYTWPSIVSYCSAVLTSREHHCSKTEFK